MLLLPSPSFFLIIFIPFVAIQSFAEDIPYFSYCYGDNFTSPSFYERSIHLLFRHIEELGLLNKIGVIGNSPSFEVFVLAQCRPHISFAICYKCINYSASAVISNSSGGCGSSRSAVIRFDDCVLRYSDRPFFGIPEQKPFRFIPTKSLNVTDGINVDARDRLRDVLRRAAMDDSRFMEQITEDSGGLLIVAVAWCTMDLSTGDCLHCLRRAEESFPDGKYFGIVTSISCEVRLSTYPTSLNNTWSPSPLWPLPASNSTVLVAQPRSSREGKMSKSTKMMLLFVGVFGVVISSLLFITFFLQQKRRNKKLTPLSIGKKMEEDILDAMKSTVFDLGAIRAATNNFTEENMLGHCGFATIYKGVLQNGQEIAVKRLSRTSEQGLAEMENEVNLVTKLQHKNIVRLLGYFLEEKEKLLVYEYLPNASLAKFLYDPVKRRLLDWGTRFKIIIGISRGLLYLHEDSLHRMVHCNLNASNILLDSSMNPKISEFGFAKLFSVDETERYISQSIGTFEYMAPESAHHGLFSTKSDVFCFGVLVLEIITGQRIGNNAELIRNVWKYWKQGMAWKVIDKSMGAEYSSTEAFKCIEIGLLCLQENHRDRPDIASLVALLGTL